MKAAKTLLRSLQLLVHLSSTDSAQCLYSNRPFALALAHSLLRSTDIAKCCEDVSADELLCLALALMTTMAAASPEFCVVIGDIGE